MPGTDQHIQTEQCTHQRFLQVFNWPEFSEKWTIVGPDKQHFLEIILTHESMKVAGETWHIHISGTF